MHTSNGNNFNYVKFQERYVYVCTYVCVYTYVFLRLNINTENRQDQIP